MVFTLSTTTLMVSFSFCPKHGDAVGLPTAPSNLWTQIGVSRKLNLKSGSILNSWNTNFRENVIDVVDSKNVGISSAVNLICSTN